MNPEKCFTYVKRYSLPIIIMILLCYFDSDHEPTKTLAGRIVRNLPIHITR